MSSLPAKACRVFLIQYMQSSGLVIHSSWKESGIGKSYPMALRERVIAYVDEGHGDREAARHFRALPRFVNDLVIMIRQTGSLALSPGDTLEAAGLLRIVNGLWPGCSVMASPRWMNFVWNLLDATLLSIGSG